jgi:hypothetical protein
MAPQYPVACIFFNFKKNFKAVIVTKKFVNTTKAVVKKDHALLQAALLIL